MVHLSARLPTLPKTNLHLMKLLSLLILFFTSQICFADIPKHDPVPGGIAVIKINPKITRSDVRGFFKKRRIMIKSHEGENYAIIGLPLSLKPDTYSFTIKNGNKTYRQKFAVADKKYQTQHITVKNKRHVNPNKNDMARIGREKKFIAAALTNWSEQPDPPTNFIQPAQGIYSSPFGLRRFFNGQARRPHSGLDIAAAAGTPVIAPAAGKIIEIGDYFFNGKTVFIDHGQNLISMYCHLSEVTKTKGSVLKQGELFAKVGKTGRVTGAHLHWSVSLNNTRVEPTLFLQNK